jgi:DNA-binding NtrC family response regulator
VPHVIEEPYPSSTTLEIEALPPRGTWVVEVQDESGARQVALSAEKLVFGSSRSAGVVVHDPTVSGRHCALHVLGAGVAIEDLQSRNGTYVGTARVREAWGRAGTVVAIGRSTLIVHLAEGRGGLETPGEPLPGVAGASIAMRRLADQVRRLAAHALPVLVAGESGTGKELIARALHQEGPRRAQAFVAINVTALPRELVESELFGHERGAFTGAHARRAGAFAEAQGGTLFLDEIGDLPVDAQPKLLRALDGYEVRRVGGSGGKRSDVRVVAATHAPLEQRVTRGDFRRDLFHRLECFVVSVPALRERRGDIAAIARELLRQVEPQVGERKLTPAALARLAAFEWPGNVRELRNVLCRAADAATRTGRIDAEEVDAAMRREPAAAHRLLPTASEARELLRQHGGNMSAAAKAAGMPRTSFRKLLGR